MKPMAMVRLTDSMRASMVSAMKRTTDMLWSSTHKMAHVSDVGC